MHSGTKLPLKLQWAVINVERLEARFDAKKKRDKREKKCKGKKGRTKKREKEGRKIRKRRERERSSFAAKLDVLIKRKAG